MSLEVTRQIVWNGVVDGFAIGMLALGIVLIFRASGVINFAVGALGVLSASLLSVLHFNYDWAFWPAAAVSVAAGALFAAAVELTVITRLFRAPRVILLVATIGIAQFGELLRVALPDTATTFADRYPTAIDGDWEVWGVRISGAELTVVISVAATTAALSFFLRRTRYGQAIRASAANADLARLSGISPKIVSTITWTIAGALSSIALILLAGTNGSPSALGSLGPATLVQVLAAALIGRLQSFPLALTGGIAIGLTKSLLFFNYPSSPGLFDAVLFLIVVATSWLALRGQAAASDDDFTFVPTPRPLPASLSERWWVRHSGRLGISFLTLVAVLLPLLVTTASRQFLYSRMLVLAIVAISLVVLTGWSGQVSLGQGALAGFGALTTAALVDGRDLGVGVGGLSFDIAVPETHFLAAVPLAALATAAVAALLGLGALRVRGFQVTIATLAFALVAQQFLWRRPFLSGGSSTVTIPRADTGPLDLTSQRTYYYLCLAVLVVVLVLVARMRATGVGRRWLAVRDSPDTAAANTVSPRGVRLQSFAVSGFIAGLGGALLGGLLPGIGLSEQFRIEDSVEILAIAVIGGIGTVAGPVLGAIWIVGLPAIWPTNPYIPLLTSSLGLLMLLMYFPGGLGQMVTDGRSRVLHWYAARLPDAAERPTTQRLSRRQHSRTEPAERAPALDAADIVVSFDGVRAVDNASVQVRRGEVIGLIGTNGAGKTTLMNAVGGFVPSTGTISVNGTRLDTLPPARRAAHGLGRTFQAARLYPQLTVLETLAVATESQLPTSFTSAVGHLPAGYRRDRAQRAQAAEVADFLGLGPFADRFISELSTGTRRIVELGSLLALDARVLFLDEPTGGVAQREVEAFAPLLLSIRDELDASLLVIEHDMPMIMSISDRMYCLEMGVVIAEGTPEQVRTNPRVIASYLGTDERAIRRSGATAETDLHAPETESAHPEGTQ